MFFTPAHVSYWVTISSVKQTALGSCAQVAQKEARQMPEGNQETRGWWWPGRAWGKVLRF